MTHDRYEGLTDREIKAVKAHERAMRERRFENDMKEMDTRARSIMVGTAFGGTSEVSMRRPDGTITWALLQPVEMVEVINQMAAAIGCHVHLQPRQDFASWRSWNYTPEELTHFRGVQSSPGVGHAPHAKALVDGGYATSLPESEKLPGTPTPMLKEEHAEVMAIEAPKQRRKSKRTAASS